MRIIYINIGGSLKENSIYKKIQGQINGFIHNGVDCKGCFLITDVDQVEHYSESIEFIPVQKANRTYFPQLEQQYLFLEALEQLLTKEDFDYVYLRFPFSHPKLLSILKQHPKKIIIECNSNKLAEIKSHFKEEKYTSFISAFLSKLQDKYIPILYYWLFMYRIINEAFLIVGVTLELSELYKTKKTGYLTISNGINISKYPTRKAPTIDSNKVIMLILDGTSTSAPWQGMDRLIKSIQKHQLTEVLEVWTCSNKNKYANYPFIKELGYLEGEQLTKVFDQVHIGSGNFSLYRLGIKDICSLKSREYMARGLPLAYIGNDFDIENTSLKNYAYKMPNEDSIINFPSILTWLSELYEQKPNHPLELHQLSEEHLDFKIKTKQLVDYLNQHA